VKYIIIFICGENGKTILFPVVKHIGRYHKDDFTSKSA